MAINSITTNDVVKKAQLNNDIVKATSNAHGGLVFNNGQLSVGHKRRIFSRSTKALINRTQPTQGSGSLYTTCSLGEVQMVSGSEMVYFNGLLLTKDNGQDGGNPKDGDYKVSYQSGAGTTPGTYVFNLTSGSTGFTNATYGPVSVTAQALHCVGTGSSDFLFFLSDGTSTQLPSLQSGLNFNGTAQEIRVEAISGITDWRDVADNFFEKIKLHMDTINGIATVTSSSAASIAGTASITVAYASIEGGIRVGSGQNGSRELHIAHSQPVDASAFNLRLDPTLGGSQIQTNFSSGQSGEPAHNGGFPTTTTSGSTAKNGARIFLSENLAMDSDDVVVVQYLSGSHQF